MAQAPVQMPLVVAAVPIKKDCTGFPTLALRGRRLLTLSARVALVSRFRALDKRQEIPVATPPSPPVETFLRRTALAAELVERQLPALAVDGLPLAARAPIPVRVAAASQVALTQEASGLAGTGPHQ